MSQIETIMLVALGFIVAALAALIISRVGWSYAVKLGNRRTERDAPAKIAALQAERDQLRAEYAMLARKLELRLDDLKTRLAEQTAEVSRNRNRVDHMVSEIQARDALVAEHEADVRKAHEQIAPLEEELAVRTQTNQRLKEQIAERDEEIARLSAEVSSLTSSAIQQDRELQLLRQQVANAPSVPELTTEVKETQSRLHERIAQLTSLSSQIEQQRNELKTQHEEFASKQAELMSTEQATETEGGANSVKPKNKSTGKKPAASRAAARKKPAAKKSTSRKSAAKKKSLKKAPAKSSELALIEKGSPDLESQIESAEKESRDLQAELSKLDKVWTEKLDALQKVAGNRGTQIELSDSDVNVSIPDSASGKDDAGKAKSSGEETTGRNFQNVISLAARIRALQRRTADD